MKKGVNYLKFGDYWVGSDGSQIQTKEAALKESYTKGTISYRLRKQWENKTVNEFLKAITPDE